MYIQPSTARSPPGHANHRGRTDHPERTRQTDPVSVSITAGRLLLATPPLTDPSFDRTVVYVVEHRTDGALGLVLNRPTDEPIGPPLDQWIGLLGSHAVAFEGGPVEQNGLLALGTFVASGTEPTAIGPAERITSVDLAADPTSLAGELRALRIFRGFAGWGPGQLDAELAQGAWIVVDAEPDDVVGADPQALWRSVLRRQHGRLAWLADAPDDLERN